MRVNTWLCLSNTGFYGWNNCSTFYDNLAKIIFLNVVCIRLLEIMKQKLR